MMKLNKSNQSTTCYRYNKSRIKFNFVVLLRKTLIFIIIGCSRNYSILTSQRLICAPIVHGPMHTTEISN